MGSSLAEGLVARTTDPRVVPLEVPRGYRDSVATELPVSLARRVGCPRCLGEGCQRCERVGWSVVAAEPRVLVPAGATPGTRITVDDAGDEVGGVARPIVVEIVQPGPRADELRAAQADFEGKLETAWLMERAARGAGQRRVRLMVGAALAFLAIFPVALWLGKPGVGEPCKVAGDCRSGQCIRLMSIPRTAGPLRFDGAMCTASCETDLDCPSSMGCRVPSEQRESASQQIAVDVPAGPACMPRGY